MLSLTVLLVYGFVRFAFADWLLLCGCYALTSVVVWVGVMDTCGCLKTGGGRGRGGYGWLGFKTKFYFIVTHTKQGCLN